MTEVEFTKTGTFITKHSESEQSLRVEDTFQYLIITHSKNENKTGLNCYHFNSIFNIRMSTEKIYKKMFSEVLREQMSEMPNFQMKVIKVIWKNGFSLN